MKSIFRILILVLAFATAKGQTLPLIPKPEKVIQNQGTFSLTSQTKITVLDTSLMSEQRLFNGYLDQYYKINLKKEKTTENAIQLSLNPSLGPEAYSLNVSPAGVQIAGGSKAGVFYGIQTLIQLIPTEGSETLSIPCVKIEDRPGFGWRGMHLDVSRHFFPVEFIKKYIDILASYKMNTFHWHLTDDQGWRIEIKKYPKLTETGAWRKGSMIGSYKDHKFDTLRYGGYYTQEQIKEVVGFAQKRHITIVPEIEMPGHSLAAIAAYPNLSCTGKPVDVGMSWGVEENVFCPTEETFQFLSDVLTEVSALFPGKYIHIGGDEVPKASWKKSEFCQELMKKEKLKDDHELQSWFIRRIEKKVNELGKQIIGWDEILEGGLAPNAAVMSWRGTEGGIAAAKQSHYVVMSPGSHCYFDHYQGTPANEPLAIGGYTTVEKTYSYDPIPKELNATEARYIMGAQGNVWTEYITTPEHAEYMAVPRMSALAEVVWTPSNQKNFQDFKTRLIKHFSLLDKKGIHYSQSIFEVKATVSANRNYDGIILSLETLAGTGEILYGINGNPPAIPYKAPIPVTQSGQFSAIYTEKGIPGGKPVQIDFHISKSTGRKITLNPPASEYYPGDGGITLINGRKGSPQYFGYQWLGWSGKNMEAIIDLGQMQPVSSVTLGVLERKESWIYLPKSASILLSSDGKTFEKATEISSGELRAENGQILLRFPQKETRYIKVIAENAGKIPDGAPGAGENAWLFVDEIEVN